MTTDRQWFRTPINGTGYYWLLLDEGDRPEPVALRNSGGDGSGYEVVFLNSVPLPIGKVHGVFSPLSTPPMRPCVIIENKTNDGKQVMSWYGPKVIYGESRN